MIEIFLGVLFALLLIWVSRRWNIESWCYSLSLIFLPLIYMAFGLAAEGDNIVLYEFYYGIPFFVVAILTLMRELRWAGYLVASLWLLHAVYDLVHEQLFVNSGVFHWYPVFCAAVDFVMSAYIFWYASQWRSTKMRTEAA